ncbi:MAG: hydrogenase maturation protease [Deltaproteobacteria bacterium]|nr:hydrogenase maturation protease [Deltaproteobacteria bacterium]NND30075.1 hydrogenase maturation protease [Myxococcales bacterium]MBT8465853.1 hydrogenase maturation protease [Deltaproteobacteria bacterium]MBT8481783.1 hydrogenase maturation protease [Deltaproteobacteria bacterium]NNK08108.1 hydrogenase maturation protease [Myxococcales bacterium]
MAELLEPTRIVGVGQRLAGDDGVGREVVERLRAQGISATGVDDGAGLLNVLVSGASRVLVIDAVVGGGVPGTVRVLKSAELENDPRPVSSHGIGVHEAIELGARFNPALEVTLIGISIQAPSSLREGLSPKVAAAVDDAAKQVTNLIERFSNDSGPQ